MALNNRTQEGDTESKTEHKIKQKPSNTKLQNNDLLLSKRKTKQIRTQTKKQRPKQESYKLQTNPTKPEDLTNYILASTKIVRNILTLCC